MDREEQIARLRRAKSIVNNIAVAGKNNWQALLLVTADLEAVEEALAAVGPADQGGDVCNSSPEASCRSANGTSPSQTSRDGSSDADN